MYDTLKYIIQNKMTTDAITGIWQRQDGIGANMLRFLKITTNSVLRLLILRESMWKGIPMMAASTFMHTGPVMLYFGQEVGEPGQGCQVLVAMMEGPPFSTTGGCQSM